MRFLKSKAFIPPEQEPKANHIPLANVGASVGVSVGFTGVFRYQHVGIGNTKSFCWGSKPM